MNSDITVIIPVYNSQNTIRKCINSLLDQTKCFPKIIIINDGSTDNTLSILNEFYSAYSQIKVVSQKNQGVSYARNKGLSMCDTKYVAFVDADDYVDTDYLYNLWIGFSKDSDIDLAVSGIECTNFNGKNYALVNLEEKIINSSQMQEDLFKINGPSGYLNNKLWKMQIITENHLCIDTTLTMSEDLLFTVEYLQFARKIAYSSTCNYHYVRNKNGLSSGIEITQNNINFKKINEDYIAALHKVIKKIPLSLTNARRNAYAQYAIANANFSRQLRKNNKFKLSCEDKTAIKDPRNEAIKFKEYVLKNIMISKRKKIIFLLSIHNPMIMSLIDKIYMYCYKHMEGS